MQVAPSQISPAESFDIFYFIRNHTDSTTYYVRGVVYDVRTGAVLLTTNLDQAATNTRLFVKTVQAPPDPVGIGRNIVAIATVYTDSGYTTKSENYEEQEQYFLIKNAPVAFGGGGGIDMRDLREVVAEEVAKGLKALPAPKELELPDQPDMSFVDALFGTLGAITREIGLIPKDAADLSAVTKAVDALRSAIEAIPTAQETDLSPVLEGIQNLAEQVGTLADAIKALPNDINQNLVTLVKGGIADLGKSLEGSLTQVIESQEFSFPVQRTVRKNPGPEQAEAQVPAHIL